MGENSNGSRKDIINSKANVKDAVEDEEDDDDEDEDDEDQDVSDEENEDDNEEDDDDDDNDFSDSDTDDEEEKHGWEKMDHEGKEYYWNWDTEETVWERPDGYRSPGAESSGEDSPERKKTTNMRKARASCIISGAYKKKKIDKEKNNVQWMTMNHQISRHLWMTWKMESQFENFLLLENG